jgi:hypothetical protein
MAPTKHHQALNAYVGLMEEAKHRLQAMDTALGGRTGLPPGAIKEYCFLQLRMLCELIALGCLTAHGDLAAGKLRGSYKADNIIRGLQRLHPNFYPIAAIRTETGPKLREGGLTKEELLKLYWKCGDVLHRGSFKALPARHYSDDIEEIRAWKKKIEALSCHGIYTVGEQSMMLFWIRDEDGRAWWETWEPRWPNNKEIKG